MQSRVCEQQRSCSPGFSRKELHATESAVEVRRARRRLEDTVTDERVGLFTPDKDGYTHTSRGRVAVLTARRGTVCGEVGRVPRFCSTQHPHPLLPRLLQGAPRLLPARQPLCGRVRRGLGAPSLRPVPLPLRPPSWSPPSDSLPRANVMAPARQCDGARGKTRLLRKEAPPRCRPPCLLSRLSSRLHAELCFRARAARPTPPLAPAPPRC